MWNGSQHLQGRIYIMLCFLENPTHTPSKRPKPPLAKIHISLDKG